MRHYQKGGHNFSLCILFNLYRPGIELLQRHTRAVQLAKYCIDRDRTLLLWLTKKHKITFWEVNSYSYIIITPWPVSASELYQPSDLHFSANLVPIFADRGCCVVSTAYPYSCNLSFLDRSHYFFFQVAPQVFSRGWEDSVPDPLLLRKSGSTRNRTRTSGSIARNSDD
jgi:hypothetical protein